MVEYYLSTLHGCSYHFDKDRIGIGMNPNHSLTDDEVIILLSESIMHEHIHRVLYKMFNRETSKLFETIEEHFRTRDLLEKESRNDGSATTWKLAFQNKTISYKRLFLGISEYEYKVAYNTCNKRK